MKAFRLHGPMDFKMDEISMPACKSGEVKIRTEYCGICGSDIPRVLEGRVPFFPNTLGHEFCGTVTEVGDGVTTVSNGDLVQVIPQIVCHNCDHCKNGHFGQCLKKQFMGLRVKDKGGFAEYNNIPEKNVIKLPNTLEPLKATFIEPASIALHSIARLNFKPGKDVAVIGAGSIGQLTIQCLKLMGARKIYVFDVVHSKLDLAKKFGADYCYNTSNEGFFKKFLQDTKGFGVEQVIELVGLETTVLLSMEICNVGGIISVVGNLGKNINILPDHFRMILEKQLNLKGVWMSYSLNWPGDPWRLAIHYIKNDLIDIKPLIYKVESIKNINKVFRLYKNPEQIDGKIIVTFNDN